MELKVGDELFVTRGVTDITTVGRVYTILRFDSAGRPFVNGDHNRDVSLYQTEYILYKKVIWDKEIKEIVDGL
jgi:hypothetical protein